MGHVKGLVLIVCVLLFVGQPVFAKAPVGKDRSVSETKGLHLKGAKGDTSSIHAMMKPCSSAMVATSDGGIIVFVGGKLKKFDKDLNLLKEVVVESDCPGKKEPSSKACVKKGPGASKEK